MKEQIIRQCKKCWKMKSVKEFSGNSQVCKICDGRK